MLLLFSAIDLYSAVQIWRCILASDCTCLGLCSLFSSAYRFIQALFLFIHRRISLRKRMHSCDLKSANDDSASHVWRHCSLFSSAYLVPCFLFSSAYLALSIMSTCHSLVFFFQQRMSGAIIGTYLVLLLFNHEHILAPYWSYWSLISKVWFSTASKRPRMSGAMHSIQQRIFGAVAHTRILVTIVLHFAAHIWCHDLCSAVHIWHVLLSIQQSTLYSAAHV